MKRFLLAVVLVAVVGGGAAAAAQVPVVTDQNARQTRDQLREILQQYPPSLADVLQLDPSLLTKEDYVAPYPALAAFLKQHAEIAHNPSFFLGGPRPAAFANLEPRAQAMRQVGEAVAGFLVFFGLLAVLGGGIYLLRGLIEHRRWLQATKIQSDAHTRIVDRLSSNEELLAYLQSSTAQRFLAVAPLAADASHAPSAPIGRILWSMQSGIVVALGGAGLWIASSRVSFEEVSQPLQIVATVAIAVGLGFIVSAAASFGLSRRLGLISVDSTHG